MPDPVVFRFTSSFRRFVMSNQVTTEAPIAAPQPAPIAVAATANAKALAGIQQHLTGVTTLTLNNVDYTPAQLIALFQAAVLKEKATTVADKAYHDAVGAERESEQKIAPLRQALKGAVASRFGASSSTMSDFGFKPRKVRAPKAATVAKAVEQRNATREARGTKGKRQKEKIVGTLPAEPPPPNPQPPAPNPPPPAQPTTNGTNGAPKPAS
jgi:hypothetical protein